VRLALTLVASLLLGVCGCVSASKADAPRIDGSSDAAFDRSYVNVVQELTPQEQRRFALALFAVLLPQSCLGSDGVLALTFLPASAERKAALRPCRAQLNGKSYHDIIQAADAQDKARGGSPAPPNNRWRGP